MVEFALVLPFLAILTCGTIDAGRYYSAWNEAKNAAREGALYGQTHPLEQRPTGTCTAPDNIEDRAEQELSTNASDSSFTVTITPALVPGCQTLDTPTASPIPAGSNLTVRVTRHVELLTPLVRQMVGNIDIAAQVTVQVQG
ncbi:MAG: TadE-like protein [Nocardioidaceae bacterium]|jgi:Flp pilus assembly protein TadG|nr:TadE-like protein [Nocardioidaceae bacterium]